MKNDATSRDMFQGRVGQHCGDLRHGAQAARWRRAPLGHATIEACGERRCAWVRVWSANGSLGVRPSGARVRAWGRRLPGSTPGPATGTPEPCPTAGRAHVRGRRLRVQYTRPGHRHAGAVPYNSGARVRAWGRRLRVQYTRHGPERAPLGREW